MISNVSRWVQCCVAGAGPLLQASVRQVPLGRVRYWGAVISKFAFVQIAVQAVMALCGFIIVRSLPKREYALFVIANTMLSAMSSIADAGVTAGLMSIGGRFWRDRTRFSELVASARHVRRTMAVFCVAAITPLLVWMLLSNGATTGSALIISTAALAALGLQLDVTIYRVVPQLFSQFKLLQRLDLFAASARLIFLGALSLLFFNAALAVAITAGSLLLQWVMLRRSVKSEINSITGTSPRFIAEIYCRVRQLLPGAIFYSLQGQIWIILPTLVGRSGQVADIGALGRLVIVFNVLTSVMSAIVVPSFSRCLSANVLRRRYVQVVAVVAMFGLGAVLFASACPSVLLWFLGPSYRNLRNELVLMMISAAVLTVCGAMWMLNEAKGWTEYLWIEIPVRLLLQATFLFFFDVSSVAGVLHFTIATTLSPFLVGVWLAKRGFRSAEQEALMMAA